MKFFLSLISSMILTISVLAHDEGHGPKLGDQPKYGGKVTAVINYKDVEKGRKATLLYKAELTKNSNGLVRLYFYDKNMRLLDTSKFAKASATLFTKDSKSKKKIKKEFTLDKKQKNFEGNLPLKPRPPFNIEININKENEKLFMAFDNLS